MIELFEQLPVWAQILFIVVAGAVGGSAVYRLAPRAVTKTEEHTHIRGAAIIDSSVVSLLTDHVGSVAKHTHASSVALEGIHDLMKDRAIRDREREEDQQREELMRLRQENEQLRGRDNRPAPSTRKP